MSEKKTILQVEHVTMQFGGVVAVNNLSLEVREGEIVAIIGPNGAGKTTAFNVITGVYAPTNGLVRFDGEGCPLFAEEIRTEGELSETALVHRSAMELTERFMKLCCLTRSPC